MRRRDCSCCRGFLAFHLKFLNFLQTFIGVSIIIYSVWMLNQWSKHAGHTPAAPSPQKSGPRLHNSPLLPADADVFGVPDHILPLELGVAMVSGLDDGFGFNVNKLPSPWFIYFFMGIGIILCLVTCIGHIAAEAMNGCCLCFYTFLVIVLMLLEGALVGFCIFDKHWAEDIPYDPTGELDRLWAFVKKNIDICQWVGLALVIIQALSLLLALILRATVATRKADYDSDDDFAVMRGGNRQSLLAPQGGQASGSTSTETKGIHSDTWSTRMREKYGLNPADFMHNHVEPDNSNEDQRRCCIL
ncbi:tetraspanin-18-like [Aristolochia californica]|uniref:tetraspanin-18-like n=1 Tax=Aristolochia californica TaxID=171875 RepID=UPI0035E1B8FA